MVSMATRFYTVFAPRISTTSVDTIRNLGTLFEKTPNRRAANTTRAASDRNHLAFHSSHKFSPRLVAACIAKSVLHVSDINVDFLLAARKKRSMRPPS